MDLWVKSPIGSRHLRFIRRNSSLVASEKALLAMSSTSLLNKDEDAIVSVRLQAAVEHSNRAVTVPDRGREEAIPQPAETPDACAIDDPDCEVCR